MKPTTTAVWLLCTATLSLACRAEEPALLDAQTPESPYPVVITPTRLRQAVPDVPGSVTIITADMMRTYGIVNVVDALRLVPGMEVIRASGSDYRVSYHGTNILTPRRMNVLVDGISVYRPAYSRVFWFQLPVALDDIDRIEVTRSPNSASYGPNSMLAIVNIISKHPQDVEGGLLSATAGSRGVVNGSIRFGVNSESTAVRLTASAERDGGYDYVARSSPLQGHDSTRINRLNVRSVTQLPGASTLDVQAAYLEGVAEVPYVENYQVSFPDEKVHDFFLSGIWTNHLSANHELKASATYANFNVRQPWRTCIPTAFVIPEVFNLWRVDPAYVNQLLAGKLPSGGSRQADALARQALIALQALGSGGALKPRCVQANQNMSESRSDLELQDTYVFSSALRVVAGIGARLQKGQSETIFGGSNTTRQFRLFANAEYKPTQRINLNIGGYAEHDSLTGSTFSPRAAINFHLSDNQTLRFVASNGTRSPDIYEQRANWTYALTDMTPLLNGATTARFFQSAVSPGGLTPEHIASREIGYWLNMQPLGLTLDVKLFNDQLTDLISEKLQVASFRPTNANSVTLRGAELQAQLELSPSWSAFLNYAYLDNQEATTALEQTMYARNSGSIGLSHAFGSGWRGSLAYYGQSGNGVGQSSFGQEEITVAKTFGAHSARCRALLSISRLDRKTTTYFRDFGSTLESRYNNRLQLRGQLEVGF